MLWHGGHFGQRCGLQERDLFAGKQPYYLWHAGHFGQRCVASKGLQATASIGTKAILVKGITPTKQVIV